MHVVEKLVSRSEDSQRVWARRLGITAPRLNDLLRGKIVKFSIDALVLILDRAGVTVELKIGRTARRKAA
jgi:predicted XRE-type DNA-binding protein